MVCETKNVKSHINSHQQNSLQDFTFHIPCEATEESCLMRNDWLHWSFSPQLGPEDLRLKFLSDPTVLHTFGPVTVSHICFSILAARSVWLQTSVTNESVVFLHTGSISNSSTSPLWTSKSRRSNENHETKSRPQSSRCWTHFFGVQIWNFRQMTHPERSKWSDSTSRMKSLWILSVTHFPTQKPLLLSVSWSLTLLTLLTLCDLLFCFTVLTTSAIGTSSISGLSPRLGHQRGQRPTV